MQFLWQFIPAKDPQTDESGLEIKSQQRFDRQGCAKDIAHEAGIPRPVQAKVELLHDAGHHPRREVDQEDPAPEFGHAFIRFVPGGNIPAFKDSHQDRKAKRERDDEEMIDGGDGKLPS